MKIIGLAGWSGAGKTTLLTRVIPELVRRRLTVSTVKHAHHAFEVDHPGKDSYEHRMAGATEVMAASAGRWALIRELRDEPEPGLGDLLQRMSAVDLVIVEGFKTSAHPKVEVHRAANGKPFLFSQVPNVRAVAADGPVAGWSGPVADIDDIAALTDLLLAHAEPRSAVVAILAAAGRPERLVPPGPA
ncbi:molybdopterin-guanine dinucleotide biosynthesis protein B [Phreatobacter sp.]|uniref:molybdopterin-guanine dinucleotide biosynthesis protein B n=1 Tax=Phreatobacter sp. TaxID=1966341 RepID=UPI003F713DBF